MLIYVANTPGPGGSYSGAMSIVLRPLVVIVAVAAVAATACAPAEGRRQVTTAVRPDVRPTGSLTDLPPCGPPPQPAKVDPVEGLVIPNGATITQVTPVEPSVSVLGYVPLTPSQTRRSYTALTDVRILSEEDETYDAEVLLTTGSHRIFVKVVAVCDQGSQFSAIVATEAEAQGVPAVPGAGVPTPTTAPSP